MLMMMMMMMMVMNYDPLKKKKTQKKNTKIKNIPQKLDHFDSQKPSLCCWWWFGWCRWCQQCGGWCRSAQCRATLQELTNAVHHRRDRGVPWDLGFKKNNTLVMKSRAGCLVLLVFLFGGETLMHFGLKYFCLFLF